MKIKYLAHASFMITSDTGTRIITDPYVTGSALSYGEIEESADIVTVSHEHGDHNNVAAVRGNPQVVTGTARIIPVLSVGAPPVRSGFPELPKGTEEISGMKFRGIPTYHDDAGGKLRGENTIICFEVDGIRVCHLGDLGHRLSDKQLAELGKVDILLTPVGGGPTIDAKVATEVCNQLRPKVIIPMHYKTDKCGFPALGVGEFLQGKEGVSRLDVSEVEFKRGELPASTQIIVLKSAL